MTFEPNLYSWLVYAMYGAATPPWIDQQPALTETNPILILAASGAKVTMWCESGEVTANPATVKTQHKDIREDHQKVVRKVL